MNNKPFKFIYIKKIIAFVFISLILLLSSCASAGESKFDNEMINGLAYEYYDKFYYDRSSYVLFKPSSVNLVEEELTENMQALQYVYQELNYEGVDAWRVNYYYQYDIVISNTNIEDEVVNKAYDIIKTTLPSFEEALGISFEEYDFNTPTHIELISKDATATKTYLTVLYLPFYLVCESTNQNYIIHIPVKTFFAYRYDDVVKFDFLTKETSISYTTFASLSNISNIIERGNKYV